MPATGKDVSVEKYRRTLSNPTTPPISSFLDQREEGRGDISACAGSVQHNSSAEEKRTTQQGGTYTSMSSDEAVATTATEKSNEAPAKDEDAEAVAKTLVQVGIDLADLLICFSCSQQISAKVERVENMKKLNCAICQVDGMQGLYSAERVCSGDKEKVLNTHMQSPHTTSSASHSSRDSSSVPFLNPNHLRSEQPRSNASQAPGANVFEAGPVVNIAELLGYQHHISAAAAPAGVGCHLKNLGNTCFADGVICALSRSAVVISYAHKHLELHNRSNSCTACAFSRDVLELVMLREYAISHEPSACVADLVCWPCER